MRRLPCTVLAGAAFLALAGAAQAATITVDSTADAAVGQCTLRGAITAANTDAASGGCAAGSGPDAIVFGSVTGTITLASPLPAITAPVTITGPGSGALTVSGGDAVSILYVGSFAGSAAISGITISHGACSYSCALRNDGTTTLDDVTLDHNVAGVSGGANAFPEAGAIGNNGTLTLTNGTISANAAVASGGTSQNGPEGGAVYNGSGGTLTIDRSTVIDNHATAIAGAGGTTNAYGGAIDNSGTLHVRRSSFIGNVASASASTVHNAATGGAIGNGNGPTVSVTIDGSTFAGNAATSTGTGSSTGGAFNVFGTSFAVTSSTISDNGASAAANVAGGTPLTIANTIVSDPQGGGANCTGTISSGGHNLTDVAGCGFTAASDIVADPMLDHSGPADNGGPSKTIALLAGSPAIDAGLSSAGETTDQRGLARPIDFAAIADAAGGDGSDIGAFEAQVPVVVVVPPDPGPVVPPDPGPGGAPDPGPSVTAPVLSALSLAGLHVSFRLTAAASVSFRIERARAGRRVRGRCVAATHRNRSRHACTRYQLLAGSFTRPGVAGVNAFAFSGRLNGRRLPVGRYRLRALATDSGGRHSAVLRAAFRVKHG